jgi:peptide/nickel transport system permease protein
MTTADRVTAPAGWRAWLLAETPASRGQARLGQAYVGWLGFRRNPLAMTGSPSRPRS